MPSIDCKSKLIASVSYFPNETPGDRRRPAANSPTWVRLFFRRLSPAEPPSLPTSFLTDATPVLSLGFEPV